MLTLHLLSDNALIQQFSKDQFSIQRYQGYKWNTGQFVKERKQLGLYKTNSSGMPYLLLQNMFSRPLMQLRYVPLETAHVLR